VDFDDFSRELLSGQAGTFFVEKKFVLLLRRTAFESRERRVFSFPPRDCSPAAVPP
jgi:hypothetical protein